MREPFTAFGTLFLAAEYAFLAADIPFLAFFAGVLALTALMAARTGQLQEKAANEARRTSGPRPFSLPDMSFVPTRAVKTASRHRVAKAA